MKKRIYLASIMAILLILVSTQVVFLKTVKSDPTQHAGDADAGDLWISELDVSSELVTINNIGIGHANATDDWPVWEDGSGNINASWSVDIGNRHPEFYVIFSMAIFNVDDENKVIGNDSFSKTYNEGYFYDESGTLSVALEFTQQQQEMGSQTLVCYLDAQVTINDTIEAVNFTSVATDRCVIVVDFASAGKEQPPPFSIYTRHANERFPAMSSWIYGWDAPSLFDSEEDMLDTQTYFQVGGDITQPSGGDGIWYLGELVINLTAGGPEHVVATFTADMLTANWKYNYPENDPKWIWGQCTLNYTINDRPGSDDKPIIMRYQMKSTERSGVITTYPEVCEKTWKDCPCYDLTGEINGSVRSHELNDVDEDGNMSMVLRVWYKANGAEFPGFYDFRFKIHIDPNGDNDPPENSGATYYWEEACAYVSSYSIGVTNSTSSGITTISVDISNILDENEELIYTFSADADDERVEFTV